MALGDIFTIPSLQVMRNHRRFPSREGHGQSCPELDQSTVQTGSEEEAALV